MKNFTTEFKLECDELVTIQGYPVRQAPEAMNIGYLTLQKCVRHYRKQQIGITLKPSAISAEQKRI